MNSTQLPGSGPPPRSPARDTLRDMWDSRPLRPRDDRKLAGVAAAIARRYEIDPTLVRVGFVVATIVGPGLPLYLAGCAVLPDAGRPGGPPPQRSGPSSALSVTLLVLAALLAVPLVLEADRLIAAVVTVALLVLLHLARGNRPGAREAAASATPLVPWTTGPHAPTAPVATTGTPPAWDPLGVAPFAWDLPEPGPEPAPPPAPRSALTPVTLAVALVVAGMVGGVVLAAPGALPPSAVPGAALAVVGIGLVVGAFRRAGRWLAPFSVLLALVTAVSIPFNDAVGPDGWAVRGGIGEAVAAPATVAELAPEYRRGTGSVELDLTRLDLTATPQAAGPVRTRAEVGVGSVLVRVPPGADLDVRGSVGTGDLTVDGQTRSGQDVDLTVADPGPDGPGGRVLELDLRAELGTVEVVRG
ncbi:PspC domain-containing protein [Pseudonocardia spirodelae]|uniref:PspC domain-containing protein n=1 Tax=Pseudonocardia spirodelae TaxID=3133431 RepID=A0ABU8T8P2_9PSEU